MKTNDLSPDQGENFENLKKEIKYHCNTSERNWALLGAAKGLVDANNIKGAAIILMELFDFDDLINYCLDKDTEHVGQIIKTVFNDGYHPHS